MLDTVLVANRGEIARRIFRTLRRLGIRSVAVYSDADAAGPHVREADDAVRIGPAEAARSYLSIDAILDAAERSGAAAIHPGYGFLSENAAFARACAEVGVAFIGPPPEAMELMGDKVRAKLAAEAAGIPVVPGLQRPGLTDDEILAWGEAAAYPVLVKAAAGGGGRGMRVVERPEELAAAIAAARREAAAGFGDDGLLVERYVPRARHIEVQVLCDRHGTALHFGERECSLQRRHQKVVEESPSAVVGDDLRRRLGEEATRLAARAGYVGAGTVEFIADAEDPEQHWFLEMNARLQVEHPVTELVTGVDLVELQLRVAAGERLELSQDDVVLRGHAVEARVTAEDAARGFLPAAGRVLAYREPAGAGVRVDSGIAAGTDVTTAYDSLLCKVIAHGPDRAGALARLDRALAGLSVLGVTTTSAFLRELLAAPEVQAARLDTSLLGRLLSRTQGDGPAGAGAGPDPRRDVTVAAALVETLVAAEAAGDDPFARNDGWRLGGARGWAYRTFAVEGGEPLEVRVRGTAAALEYDAGEGPHPAAVERVADDAFAITAGGERRTWTCAWEPGADTMWLGRDGAAWRVRRPSSEERHEASVHGELRAPMPGQVLLVPAAAGEAVSAGDPVVVLESMKMELTIAAPVDGVVTDVLVRPGDRVGVDQPLAHVAAGGDGAGGGGEAER